METEHKQRYIIDQVGEETDLKECALCYAASCFACVSDHCTALKKLADGGCTFYKDYDEGHGEIRRCFYRLISNERFDLLFKYADTIAALGLMESESALADGMREELEKHRVSHMKMLLDQNWKDSLIAICPLDDADEPEEETAEESEDAPDAPETVIDNSLDNIELPATMTDKSIDDETAEEIETRECILREEVKVESFHIYEILHEANERLVMETGQDNLPEDYGDYEDGEEDLETDENGTPLTRDEYTERAEEKEREKEAEEEKRAGLMQADRDRAEDGEETYAALPLNYFYKAIGFPVHCKQPPDPVALACCNLGANIVYQAAEDYIETLRMLWSGEYQEHIFHRLIVRKWQLETYIGSRQYWQFTNIGPERILDQCWKTAKEQAAMKIERINKRIAAGIEERAEG